jgi:hypothetical protein
MHQAPTVHWDVPRMQAHALALLFAWLAGVVAHGSWWLQAGQPATLPHALGVVLVLGSGAAALAGWILAVPGRLHWTGATWVWGADGKTAIDGKLTAAVDLPGLMVLRFESATRGVRWLWVGLGGGGAQWLAFRRAVFTRPDATGPAEPAVAGGQSGGAAAP